MRSSSTRKSASLTLVSMSQSESVASEPSHVMAVARGRLAIETGNGERSPTRSCAPAGKPRDRQETSVLPRPNRSSKKPVSSKIDQKPLTRTSRRPYCHAPPGSALPSTSRTSPVLFPERPQESFLLAVPSGNTECMCSCVGPNIMEHFQSFMGYFYYLLMQQSRTPAQRWHAVLLIVHVQWHSDALMFHPQHVIPIHAC